MKLTKTLLLKILPWTAGVLLLIFLVIRFNPLGIWSSSKISLGDTPTVLEELKELGEFITAEYSGETIESLEGAAAAENLIRQKLDSMPQIYGQIRTAYQLIVQQNRKDKHRKRAWKNSIVANKYEAEFELARKALKMSSPDLLDYMIQEELDWLTFWERHESELMAEANRDLLGNNKNVKVAYIGRGRVKAGFDLSEVDNPIYQISMSRNATGDTMQITNLDPEILDADINPWYIYQPEIGLEIPGYELFKLSRPNKVEFEDITAVKLACKEKLIHNALNQRDILGFAIESGQETFRGLFNMFRKEGEPELAYVKIIPTPFSRFKAEILEDQRIIPEEVAEVRQQLARAGFQLTDKPAQALLLSLSKHQEKVLDPAPWNSLMEEAGL